MEKEEEIYFDYIGEDGVVRKAEVLTLFGIEGRDKKYALCSVPTDSGEFNIMAFIVNEADPDAVSFDDIVDPDELSEAIEASNYIIDGD